MNVPRIVLVVVTLTGLLALAQLQSSLYAVADPLHSSSRGDKRRVLHGTPAPARDGGNNSSKQLGGGCDASFVVVTLLRAEPVFRDRQVKQQDLNLYFAAKANLSVPLVEEQGANTVTVDDEDVARARTNVVRMLRQAPLPVCPLPSDRISSSASSTVAAAAAEQQWRRRTVSARIFNIVRNAIQEVAIDGSPIVVDFGCVLGETFAAIHTLSSVICVLLQFSEKYRDHIRSYVRSYPALPRNMVHLYTPSRSFVTGELVEIYTLCNLFTIALVLEAVEDPTLETESVVAHAAKTVAVAHTTIVAFPLLPQQSQQQLLAQQDSELLCQMITDMIQRGLEKDSSVQFSCDVIARVQQSAQVLVVTRLVQISSSRGCRKTWGAPLVQWDRSQSVMFDHGAVTFRVNKVNKKKDGGGVEASSVMRVIHPLQYLHSFNLDHLLGAGLDLPQRLEFFGQMLQTPRYSDPLPHNWVLGGAGRLQRIDKVDLRYDRDVDESKGYWGHSTRGYLHLLGVHLCIPLGADGLPMALREMNRSCQQRCVACSCKCSYLPKGQAPCPSCMQCGECLREHAFSAQLLGSVDTSRLPRKCQKLYSSMDSARKEWRRWERADARYIQAQCDEV